MLAKGCQATGATTFKDICLDPDAKEAATKKHGVKVATNYQLVHFVVNDRGLFTAGWFGAREKYCSSLYNPRSIAAYCV